MPSISPKISFELIASTLGCIGDAVLITSESRETLYYNEKLYRIWEVDEKVISEYTSGHKEIGCKYADKYLKHPDEFVEIVHRVQGTLQETNDTIEFIDGRVFKRRGVGIRDEVHGICRIWFFTDVTEKKYINTDSLTKCLNRAAWDEFTQNQPSHEKSIGGYAVAVIDINNFKLINDEFGHEAGDKVLRRVGTALLSVARDQDLVFRIGGDEFCLVVPTRQDINQLIEQRIAHCFVSSGINASVGIAMASEHGQILEAFRKADVNMLRSKKDGKIKVQSLPIHHVLPQARITRTDEELELLSELNVALEKREIYQLYQPIVDVNGSISSVEVLMRWNKNGVSVPPSTFIPLAEESGCIHAIWNASLLESVTQLAAWKKKNMVLPVLRLNFSGAQVEYAKNSGHSYAKQISSICELNGIPPSLIRIELTETVLLQDLVKAKEIFEELAAIGVHLSIDDYGTGFSSLSVIKMLPVTSIKIDGSFIHGLPDSAPDCSIVSTLLSLARAMDIIAVVECVESSDQYDYIKGLSESGSGSGMACETLFQGYLFSKPVQAEALEQMLPIIG